MAWIRLLDKDWDYRLPQATIGYKAGHTYNVPRAAATLAVAAGKAVRIATPKKEDVDGATTT